MLKAGSEDTIAAIATSLGEGAIGIVRLSGSEALKIADRIFVSKSGLLPSQCRTYTLHYGFIIDPRFKTQDSISSVESQGSTIQHPGSQIQGPGSVDEVLLTLMRSPRSYTKEDVVEISCHGGIVALGKVLDIVLASGARLGQPGEFTRRAFLNGRIDLSQAEAVADIIRAKTSAALTQAVAQLQGGLSLRVKKICAVLLDILALTEAQIDFPEEEIPKAGYAGLRQRLSSLQVEIKELLEKSRYGRLLREGVSVVICGRPNVGKSSLLNAIVRFERSIVTPIAGTTRDAIEDFVEIKGIPVKITDTAGIITPRDIVERKAIKRAKGYIAGADIVLVVFDGSSALSPRDKAIIRRLRHKTAIAVINKTDLARRLTAGEIAGFFSRVVEVSAKKGRNLEGIENAIAGLVYKGQATGPEPLLVANARHISKLTEAKKLIEEALNSLDNKLPSEFFAQSLRDALAVLDEMLGVRFSEDLLDKIFSGFCIGK